MLSPTVDTVRLFIHVLAASLWVGGQIVLAGMVPGLRKVGPDATRAAANGFARMAWPAYGVLFFTGIWSLTAQEGSTTSAYLATLGIKLLLVLAVGVSAFLHSQATNKVVVATTGALGGILSLTVLYLGLLLANHG